MEGWTPTGVKTELEDGPELYRAAQQLSLVSPLTWGRTTLELGAGEVPGAEFRPPRSLATFTRALDTDTDTFNACFEADPGLRDRVEMYIGRTEGGFTCRLAHCSYTHTKKVLLKYHVLAHLGVPTFKPPDTQVREYVDFVRNTFRKKTEEEAPDKVAKKEQGIVTKIILKFNLPFLLNYLLLFIQKYRDCK